MVTPRKIMEPLTVRLELPRDLLGALDVAEEELEPRLKTLIALELFREGRISSGKAAELLGRSKAEFIGLLDQHGIAYFTETPGELAAQVDDVERKIDSSASS
jgi:predicted HTH domain antitoxin